MKIIKRCYKNINEYLFEHRKLKLVVEFVGTFIATLLSAFCFSYGFRSFIAPSQINEAGELINLTPLISGGVSGFSQVLIKFYEVVFNQGVGLDAMMHNQVQSLLYFIVNIPLFVLAFLKIGKRFASFSIINVILVSLLISTIPYDWTIIFNITDDFLARALFAGLLTGLSTTIAVKFGHSAGGVDIISIFISSRTQTSMGKYMLIFNGTIIVCFTLLSGIRDYASTALYTIVYLFTSSMVVDALCVRNKKLQLQIITSHTEMAKILILNFPHGCTVIDAKGAYQDKPKKVLYMDISASEIKGAVKVIREIDSNAFISVLHVHNVYGKFYIKPLK